MVRGLVPQLAQPSEPGATPQRAPPQRRSERNHISSTSAATTRNSTFFQGDESKNGHLKKLENAKERLHLSRQICWTLKDFVPPLLVALEFFMLPPLNLIASLTLIKDSERLDLPKEIGGTRVHEERHRESLKIMQETGK